MDLCDNPDRFPGAEKIVIPEIDAESYTVTVPGTGVVLAYVVFADAVIFNALLDLLTGREYRFRP